MSESFASLGQRGSTIVESLVAMTIGAVAIGGFLSFNIAQMYAMRDQTSQVSLQTAARTVADLFAEEVRRAGSGTNVNCTGTASTGVTLASSSQIHFKVDLNGDGALTGANEDVTYTFSSNSITRADNNNARTDTLWSGVSTSGSGITYWDSAGNQLTGSPLSAAQLLQIMRVKVTVVLTGSVFQPGSALQQTAQEGADAQIRNRYFLMAAQCPYN